ncbi:MAG: Gfo/Idh/MocA family oxidoreductase [Oscillospiraceae bacterium]|nr:Gfo/Idh/MocA family oxidoreductase [Oscillospiraceae bacterium]
MKTYNLGFIGYGGMATWHHQNLDRAPEIKPYGVYDIDPERIRVGEERGLKGYADADQLLADPNIDIVLVATPNNFHADYAMRAMRAGKNVISEKPACMNSREMLAVIQVMKETGRHYSAHQNRRWDADFLTVRQAIQTGQIGQPYVIKSKVLGSRGIPEGWRTHPEAGGGMLLDWGVHLLDQIFQLVTERAVELNCHMYHSEYKDVDDGFCCSILFASGLYAVVEVDTCCFVNEPRWHVRGDLGTLTVDNWDLDGKIVRAKDKNTVWEQEILYTSAGPTKTMAPRTRFSQEELPLNIVRSDWINFYHNYAAVLEGREQPAVKPEETLFLTRIMEDCFKSDREQRAVAIDYTPATVLPVPAL